MYFLNVDNTVQFVKIYFLLSAQDLLSQWMEEKVHLIGGLEPEIDCHYGDDDWEKHEIQSDVKREWDNLLADNYEEYGLPLSSRPSDKYGKGYCTVVTVNLSRFSMQEDVN